jgi:hypothetical protein
MECILSIDGNYFAQRVLGQINMDTRVNNLITDSECEEFFNTLTISICNLYQTFNNQKHQLISNIVFTRDHGTWRKEVPPFKPYYITDDRVIGYKEQRVKVKDESSINYDNFNKSYNEWYDFISETFITFDVKGLEGDDLLMLLSKRLTEKNRYSMIFCTDGDLKQLVNEKTFLLRNIRSKAAPNGEFVIPPIMYELIFNKPLKQTLLDTSDNQYWHNLMSIMIGSIDGEKRTQRELNRGIEIAEPTKAVFTKIFGGDKKDNIFSILGWESSTGTRNYSVSELQIEKAMTDSSFSFTDYGCYEVLNKYENLQLFLFNLRKITKQFDVNFKEKNILQHIKHNMKMLILNEKYLPVELVTQFNEQYEQKESAIFETKKYTEFVNKHLALNANTNIATNIYGQSLTEAILDRNK